MYFRPSSGVIRAKYVKSTTEYVLHCTFYLRTYITYSIVLFIYLALITPDDGRMSAETCCLKMLINMKQALQLGICEELLCFDGNN